MAEEVRQRRPTSFSRGGRCARARAPATGRPPGAALTKKSTWDCLVALSPVTSSRPPHRGRDRACVRGLSISARRALRRDWHSSAFRFPVSLNAHLSPSSHAPRPLGGRRRAAVPRCGAGPRHARAGIVSGLVLAITTSACAESEPSRATPPATVSSGVPAAATVVRSPSPSPSPSPDPSPPARGPDAGSICRTLCEHTRPLGCSAQAHCMESCVGMATATPCATEVFALYACLQREPLSRWECADDGTAAIRDGSCENEQSRAARCLDTEVKP
jgi:hypothetical protein